MPDPHATARDPLAVLDVCNLGVVLRAMLALEAVLAAVALWQAGRVPAAGLAAWGQSCWSAWAVGNTLALAPMLLWLLAVCGMQRLAGRWTALGWYGWGLGLGAALGWATAWFWDGLWLDGDGLLPWPGCTAAAAVGGWLLMHDLVLRARARAPSAARARLAELQARIRPHFLFNALNSAVALAESRPAQAQALLEDLAELFRAALAEAGEVATLESELALARRYLAIEQLRFGERMAVSWHVDPAVLSTALPPLLLQPLAENAVRHGVETSAAPVAIDIAAWRDGARVGIRIRNSVPDGAQPGHRGQGLALANVRERLALLHDLEAVLETGWLPARGGQPRRFQVMLWLPAAGGGR